MEPIIDPKLFYLCDVCETLDFIFEALIVVSIIVLFVLFVLFAFYMDCSDCFDKNKTKSFKQSLTITVIVMVVSLLGAIFVPDRKTIYQMIVFDNITENNIQASKDNIKELIDYTIEKIDEVNKEE